MIDALHNGSADSLIKELAMAGLSMIPSDTWKENLSHTKMKYIATEITYQLDELRPGDRWTSNKETIPVNMDILSKLPISRDLIASAVHMQRDKLDMIIGMMFARLVQIIRDSGKCEIRSNERDGHTTVLVLGAREGCV